MVKKTGILSITLCILFMIVSCSAVSDQNQVVVDENRSTLTFASPLITDEDIQLYSEEIQKIHEKGKITVALYSHDRPPFFYIDTEGELVGSDVDIAQAIAVALGVEVEFDRTAATFDEVVNRVALGKADLAISKLSQTLQRGKKVLFSEPYLNLHQALLINRLKLAGISSKSESSFDLVKQSSGKIGTIKGTSYVGFAKNLFPNAQIVQYDNKEELIDAALQGSILTAFYDEFEIKKYIEDQPDQSIELQILIVEGRVDPISIALNAENYHLHAWINLYLKNHEVEIDQLLKDYGIIK